MFFIFINFYYSFYLLLTLLFEYLVLAISNVAILRIRLRFRIYYLRLQNYVHAILLCCAAARLRSLNNILGDS